MVFSIEEKINQYCIRHDTPRSIERIEHSGNSFNKFRYDVRCDSLWSSVYVERTYLGKITSYEELHSTTSIQVKEILLDNKELLQRIVGNLQSSYLPILEKKIKGDKSLVSKRSSSIMHTAGLKHLQYLKQEVVKDVKRIIAQSVKSWIDNSLNSVMIDRVKGAFDVTVTTTDILPNINGCICYAGSKDKRIFVMQYEPKSRSVNIDSNLASIFNENGGTYKLAFPWIIFVVVMKKDAFDGLYCFMSNKRIDSIDSILYEPILPNVHIHRDKEDGKYCKVCIGSVNLRSKDIHTRVEEVISTFWSNRFNKDLSDFFTNHMRSNGIIKNFSTWQDNSTSKPLFGLQIPLLKYCTLREIMSLLIQYDTKETEKIDKNLKDTFFKSASMITDDLIDYLSDISIPISNSKLTDDLDVELNHWTDQVDEKFTSTMSTLLDETNLTDIVLQVQEIVNTVMRSIYDDVLRQIGVY